MYFSYMQGAIGKSDAGDAFSFAPAAPSVFSPKPSDFAKSRSCGEGLDLRNLAHDLERH
jgi:hypothetical protein